MEDQEEVPEEVKDEPVNEFPPAKGETQGRVCTNRGW